MFDLAGNAAEFCEDELPGDDADGSRRLARGGSWESGVPTELHATHRRFFATNECAVAYGFRLVRAPVK